MTTKNVRFLIKQIELYYDGDKFVEAGKIGRKPTKNKSNKKLNDNIIDASLLYPRSGAAKVSTQKVCDLPSRSKVDFDLTDFWEAGLFKEEIDTETKFQLRISDRDKIKFIEKVFALFFGAGISKKAKAVGNFFQGAVAGNVESQIKEALKSRSGKTSSKELCHSPEIFIEFSPRLKAFYIDSDTEAKINILSGKELTIDLFSSKEQTKRVSKRASSSINPSPKRKVMFKKNEKMGVAKVVLNY